jgi:predicted RNase H-like HicB family nuclease
MTTTTARRTYRATAERDGRSWLVRVPELTGVFAQARRLEFAETAISEVIGLMLDVPEDSFDVEVEPALAPDDARIIGELRHTRRELDRLQVGYSGLARSAATTLQRRGMPIRDIADLMDVSHQRVAQILASEDGKGA